MQTDFEVDPELRAEFIDESLDMLSQLDPLFLSLEASPEDVEIIQAIFRPVHSIKGNSAFFGFIGVKNLAHIVENLLDQCRKGTRPVTRAVVDVLLRGTDVLRELLTNGRHGDQEISDQARYDAVLAEVKAAYEAEVGPGALLDEAAALLRDAKEALSEDVPVRGRIDAWLQHRASSEDSGTAAETPVGSGVAAQLLGILDLYRTQGSISDEDAGACGPLLQALLKETTDSGATEKLQAALDNYKVFMASMGFDELLETQIREALASLPSQPPAVAAAPPAAVASEPAETASPAPAPQEDPHARAKEEPGKTMRVSEQHVDTFLAYVGELIVVRDMFNHLEQRMRGQNVKVSSLREQFHRVNEVFGTLSHQLQRSIMSIRLVPMNSLLQRVPRIARDSAALGGKEVHVTTQGGDIQVDKSLLDLFDAPLVHMVRNAADHGVEKPDVRKAAGKPAAGTIEVVMAEEGNQFCLSVTDDGAGLNYAAIQKKAESLGLVTPGSRLTETDVVNFLFSSGVSTAETITDISGRGVGMDVVKRMVEEAGGHISVSSTAGKGSRFEIRVPKSVTTQIMDGFLVGCSGQTYVFPTLKVLETTCVHPHQIQTVAGEGRCFRHHDRMLNLIDMRGFMQEEGTANQERGFQLVVTLASGNKRFGIAVDEVLGVQQVVLRPIHGLVCATTALAGGALMGDGGVAFIIDVDRLFDECAA
ncbi:MAG: hypothetical protein GC168_04170 [Candidatus Hydrogenedens sp.]|nr:hypothetical protein [Candidatus Hydrogenedens sp.]